MRIKENIQNDQEYSDISTHQDDPFYGDNEDVILQSASELARFLSSTNMKEYEHSPSLEDSIRSKLKSLYFKNKAKMLENAKLLNPATPRWKGYENQNGSEADLLEEKMGLEKQYGDLFDPDTLDLKVARMEQRMRLVNKSVLSFEEILIRVDQILEKTPESLRPMFEPRGLIEDVEAQAPIEVSQRELLWKNFAGHFHKIRPRLIFYDEKDKIRHTVKYEAFAEEDESEVYAGVMQFFGESRLLEGRNTPFLE